jgi:hypothetical protein
MAPREQLQREIERLETKLDRASDARAIDELATVRRGLASAGPRAPAIELPNLRLGFACTQRWEDMVGDDRVRACAGCDRPVFNLSEMTRAEAEAVLATRGLTPCVRFYRRPDGTVMTTDCPTGVRQAPRRLAVVASSLAAAGSTLAASPAAIANPPAAEGSAAADDDAAPPETTDDGSATGSGSATTTITIDDDMTMGLPVQQVFDSSVVEMGVMIMPDVPRRPAVEWSLWGRLGVGLASQPSEAVARTVTPPMSIDRAAEAFEAAAGADLTFRLARNGDLRVGVWGEARTSSNPVAGVELVLAGLPPHPYDGPLDGTGSLVLRAGANDRVITGALGFGYVGSYPRNDPWISWMRHVVGARVVLSVNRTIDEPRDWSATIGLEVEPTAVVHELLDLVHD